MVGIDEDSMELIEEDEYEVAGKLYEDYKHVFAYYRPKKVEYDDSEAEEESEVLENLSSLWLNLIG